MQKSILTCLLTLVLLISASASADQFAFECGKDAAIPKSKAQQLLNSVQSAYSKISTFQATFTQQAFLSSMEISEVSGGEVYFLKPGKMKWDYKTPELQTFVIKDQLIYLYQPTENQMIIDAFSKVLLSDLPVAFLMGIGNLGSDFAVQKACNLKEDGGKIVFELTPKGGSASKDEQLKSFMLLTDSKSFMPLGAKVRDIADNVNTIIFSDEKSNTKIEEGVFEIKPPAGTDINDRRDFRG